MIVRPVPVRSIPNSTNTWEAIYDVPPMSDAEKNEMIENPFEVRAQPHSHTHPRQTHMHVAVRAEPERLLLLRGGQAHHAHKSRVRLHTKLTCHVTPQKNSFHNRLRGASAVLHAEGFELPVGGALLPGGGVGALPQLGAQVLVRMLERTLVLQPVVTLHTSQRTPREWYSASLAGRRSAAAKV